MSVGVGSMGASGDAYIEHTEGQLDRIERNLREIVELLREKGIIEGAKRKAERIIPKVL